MRNRKVFIIAVLIVALDNVLGSVAEAQVGTEALKNLQTRPQLVVSISQRSRAVTAALDIHVRIANLTNSNIFLKRVDVYMPGEFRAARETPSRREILSREEEVPLDPGNECLVSFPIPDQETSWFAPLRNFQLLTFTASEYDVRVVVSYQIPPARDTVVQELTKVYIEPPLSSLIWGGLLGSLLLALFLSTYGFLQRMTRQSFWQEVVHALTLVLAGSICAIICIILIYRFKELPLPINISVNDFYGGVVVGLFTYKLGYWLFTQVLSGEKLRQ